MQSYEAFLNKKYRVGKKTMFLNRDPTEQAKETMQDYLRAVEQRKMAKVQNRIEQLEEEKREAKLNEEQIDEMK